MTNSVHLQSEINGFWGDLKATEEQLSYEQQNYARRLKNGLGDDIINYLNKPPKPNIWKGFKMRFKRWLLNKKAGF